MTWPAPSTITFIGAGIVAIGGFIAAYGAYRGSQASATKSDEIAMLSRSLAAKSEEIARLALENLATVTGGDSFCYLALIQREDAQGPVAVAVQDGRFPLYEVNARVVDLERFARLPPQPSIEQVLSADTYLPVGSLAAGSTRMIGRVAPLTGASRNFNVFFSARNGFWEQLIRLRLTGATWRMATKVTRRTGHPDEVTLYERVDDGYPRNNAGGIDW